MTGLFDILKESLSYPIRDIKALIIFGVFFVVVELSSILQGWGLELNTGIIGVLGILSLIAGIFVLGYYIAVLRDTLSGSDALPALDFGTNIIDGIKYLVVTIVYMIIPMIISVILAAITGVFGNFSAILDFITKNPEIVQNATSFSQAIPEDLIAGLFGGLIITGVISAILVIIFALFLSIAAARLAETGSIKEALLINKVIEDISAIGFGRYIGWYILYLVAVFIIGFIIGIVGMIPYIGVLLVALVCSPFLYLFQGRGLGLLYAEK